MSLVTRCPNCDTTFKVTLPQLQAHRGDVRCGRCAEVFDAFADLSTVQDSDEASSDDKLGSKTADTSDYLPEETIGAATASSSQSAIDEAADRLPGTEAESDEFGLGEFSELDELPALDTTDDRARQASPASAPDSFPPLATYAPVSRPSMRSDFDPAFDDDATSHDARVNWLWLGASLFLLIVLLGQIAFVFRSDLAARFPGLKPPLQQFCKMLGCSVPLPQDWETLTIESSDLKSLENARAGRIELSASLRNRARYTVAYPALDLTLTNSRDEAIARRIFKPQEYLPAKTDLAGGLPANGDLSVKLTLDTGDLNPAGYRLFMLYP